MIACESIEVAAVEPMRQVSRDGMLKLKCGKNMYTHVPTYSTTNTIIKFDSTEDFGFDDTDEQASSDSDSDSPSCEEDSDDDSGDEDEDRLR